MVFHIKKETKYCNEDCLDVKLMGFFLSSTFFLIRFEIVLTISYTSRRVLPDTRYPEGQAQRIFLYDKTLPRKEFAQQYNWPAKSFEHEALYSATSGIILCFISYFMFFCISWILYKPCYFPGDTFKSLPGARFSKVPNLFRARKAIRKTPTRLFGKAALFICCKGNKNENNCKV